MTHPHITRREWRYVLIFALALMLLTTIPYLIGAANQTSEWRFGWFMFGRIDANSYLAKMRQGAVDGWLFHNVYTPEPHDGAFLFTPYLAGGKLAALFVSPQNPGFVDAMLIVFHGSRILFGILLVLVIYRFIAVFLVKRELRWIALILICLGGGLGWLLSLIGQGSLFGSLPVDLILPEGYSFYLFYGLPHLLLARAALLGGLLLTFSALEQPSPRQWIVTMLLAGLCWLVMGLCVPFYIGVLYAILGVWGLGSILRHKQFPRTLFVRCVLGAAVPLPYLLYNFSVFATNPVFKVWSDQNTLPSPNPIHYVLGYGILAILAIPAIKWAWQRGKHKALYLLPVSWLIAAPILAYLPINVQRRFLEAIFVPLCTFAVMGLYLWWRESGVRALPRRAKTRWRQMVAVLLMVLMPTSLVIFLSGIPSLFWHNPANRLFHTAAEMNALDWMNAHADSDSVVLSSFETGNYLAARASLRTFRGHSPETLQLDTKNQLANLFYTDQLSVTQQRVFFQKYAIRYIIFDPGAEPVPSPLLKLVYGSADQVDSYRIYDVDTQSPV